MVVSVINDKQVNSIENEDIELQLLIEAIYLRYGYDFRKYSRAHIKRRVMHRLEISGFKNLSEMQYEIIYNNKFFYDILPDFSINVTEMFRDPLFYLKIREEVVPILKTYPFIKIWHAGCSSGEEVYSMAILLKEEGLYDNAQIYATDFNDQILRKAKEGIYPIANIKEYTSNYQKAGGNSSFSDYYISKYDSVIMEPSLRKNIVFADHNLVTDGVFGEMNLIVCRNVLIYFTRELQDRAIKLFLDSLCPGGLLALGLKESVRLSKLSHYFEGIAERERIYKKRLI